MSFGFDPELFVVKKGSTKATSVHLLEGFDGIKRQGLNDDMQMESKVSMKTDGFAVELNSIPESCRDRFVPSAGVVFREFYKRYKGYTLSAVPVMDLTLESLKGELPLGVTEFGCLPDRNAYTLQEKTPPRSDYHNSTRYTGGHIHWSIPVHVNVPRDLMAAAWIIHQDIVTGIPLVSMLGTTNDYGEAVRRTYYGQAGSHRVKPYGVEWRVPSSAIMLSPVLLSWILGQIRNNYWIAANGATVGSREKLEEIVIGWHKKYDFQRVQDIINGHLVDEARKFIAEFNLKPSYMPSFYDLMVKADEKKVPVNTNLAEAWAIDKPIRNHSYIGVENCMNNMGKVRGQSYDTKKRGYVNTTFSALKAFPPFTLLEAKSNDGWPF